ncbi:MAG: DNA polymerase III subunit alpha [Clostridia bacterium]|nr:DNA polymerase III subunit alpha [Clostridia bacterium]
MSDKNYVAIHVHSDYSLLDSCTDFKEYVDLAMQYGQKAIATTEHGMHRGYIEKKLYCDSVGMKLLIGVEVYLTEHLEPKIRDNYHTVLIARNQDGLKELHQLIRMSTKEDHFYYNNRISFDEFLNLSGNIITTSACLASPLNKLPDDHPYYLRLAEKYDYLEVQPHDHPEQKEFNKRLLLLSQKLGKPLIVGTDTHSSTQYMAECRAMLEAAKGKKYHDDEFDLTYKSYDQLVEMFRVQGVLPEEVYLEALENTNVLADSVEDIPLETSIKYPILYGSREADDQKFAETVEQKFQEKLKSSVIPQEQEQAFRTAIDEEMRVFRKLKMTGFMLSMSELISWCRDNDIAIGTARGSVGGSRIAYVTDIIDMNPEQWHTVFSRFANEDRQEIGDIDVDCIESDRPKIFQHIISRFGAEKCARVASYGTIQDKKVVDEVGRVLAKRWKEAHQEGGQNPYSIERLKAVKAEYEAEPEKTKKKYPEIFYYFDGLIDTKVSQSVHPAGMVISPIVLSENYGTFMKDGEWCLLLTMEEVHDGCGLAKYDFLILKTVQVIRDTCRQLGIPYPRSHEINWTDEAVWADMRKSLTSIFQFESPFAADCFKRFKTDSIEDMSLVTACIRPSGTSYRDELLARKIHKNPSPMIDELLKDNLGWLVYQEDTIKFLQQICGLSGSEADNIRRAIGRKQKERLDKAMPSILEGYCNKSDKPRETAEAEAKEFLQVIEDSASYQFGYNHSIAYCLLGYLCGYFRHYHPGEFITSFLNNAANDEDISNGTMLARMYGIRVTAPKFGLSRGDYSYDAESNIIAKGLSSIKFIGEKAAEELYNMTNGKTYHYFVDALADTKAAGVNSRQLGVLLRIDFFSKFGNQRELQRIIDLYDLLADASQIKKSKVEGSFLENIIARHSNGKTKAGKEAASWTILDMSAILHECEEAVKALELPDVSVVTKVKGFADAMGYAGYVSGNEEDRPILYIRKIFPVKRKRDGKQFGYNIVTQSIGSGKEGRFTIFNDVYNRTPVSENDVIYCKHYTPDGKGYFTMDHYVVLRGDEMDELEEDAI